MKTLLTLLLIAQTLFSAAQTWRNADVKGMNPFSATYGGAGSLNNRYFRINPYNNDIWFTLTDAVQVVTHDGAYQYYNNSNTPLFATNADFRDFAFTPQYTFALSKNYGLYQLNGAAWNLAIPFDNGINMAYDADTVWCVRTNLNYMKWYGGVNNMGSHTISRRAEIKKGLFWTSSENSGIVRWENNQPKYYSPDTTRLMDWGAWDMKFFPNTDSLFVANTAGFAIADGTVFVDSICATNSTNMPTGIILEFEFDANNNIWALFGTSNYNKTSLAHYNVATKVWDRFYDINNSPIHFGISRVTIEIDNIGNLWLIDDQFLRILDEGNAPTWLGINENVAVIDVHISPNPTTSEVTVDFEGNSATILILDAAGKTVQTSETVPGQTVSLKSLENGVYFFSIQTEKGSVVKRVVKH